jgi:hypothetical protein
MELLLAKSCFPDAVLVGLLFSVFQAKVSGKLKSGPAALVSCIFSHHKRGITGVFAPYQSQEEKFLIP